MGRRLEPPHYMVFWNARLMTPDRKIHPARVRAAAQNGLIVNAEQALPVDSDANIEFQVKYRGEMQRLRAKTKIVYCRIQSNNEGVVLEMRFTFLSNDEMHTYNNVLQVFANSKEVQLRQ